MADKSENQKEQRLLIVADARDSLIPALIDQLGISIRYSKINVQTFDLSAGLQWPSLHSFSSVLVLSPLDSNTNAQIINQLRRFVKSGGGLTFLSPTISSRTSALLGIESIHDSEPNRTPPTNNKINFTGSLFNGLQNTSCFFSDIHRVLPYKIQLTPGATIEAHFESGAPAIWSIRAGLGEVNVWSFVPMGRHWGRALLLHSVIQTQPIGVKVIANAATFQIDDFPAPLAEIKSVNLQSEFGVDWAEFIDRHWFPDILKISERFRLKPSFAVVFNYNQLCSKPFDYAEWTFKTKGLKNTTVPIGAHHAEVVRGLGTLGLHGYNHIPLLENRWKTKKNMKDGLLSCKARWKQDSLGALPDFYVPPMNVYDQMGVKAITDAMPSIRVICGAFSGSPDQGQRREFAPEPWNPNLFCLPRVTGGYELNTERKWAMLSSLYELGVWSHFIHPDDILDIPEKNKAPEDCRNPYSRQWGGNAGLKSQLENWLHFKEEVAPWLNYMHATEAADTITDHLQNQIRVNLVPSGVDIESQKRAHIQIFIRAETLGNLKMGNGAILLHQQTLKNRHTLTARVNLGTTHIRFQSALGLPKKQSGRIALVADVPNWAFSRIAQIAKEQLSDFEEISVIYTKDFKTTSALAFRLFGEHDQFDLVHFFWRDTLAALFHPNTWAQALRSASKDQIDRTIENIAAAKKSTWICDHLFMDDEPLSLWNRWILRYANAYGVSSKLLKSRYHSITPDKKIFELQDGVDLNHFSPAPKPDSSCSEASIKIGWAGNSAWGVRGDDHKGLYSIVKPAIEKLQLNGHFIAPMFCDRAQHWTPFEEMPAYYRSIDIFTSASINEGTPNTILEAMACGKPIVTTRVGIVDEAFGPLQKQFIVDERSVEAFQHKLERLIENPQLREKLREENLEQIQNWDWSKRILQWGDFFGFLLHSEQSIETIKQQTGTLKEALAGAKRHLF